MIGDMNSTPWVEPIWYCLRCDARIRESEFDRNNGVCNTCPRLTRIDPRFQKMYEDSLLREMPS